MRISVKPQGEKDIRRDEFHGNIGLQLDVGAVLVADLDTIASSLEVKGKVGDRHVLIVPQLLKRGVVVDASVIVDGPPPESRDGGLLDVRKIRQGQTGYRREGMNA